METRCCEDTKDWWSIFLLSASTLPIRNGNIKEPKQQIDDSNPRKYLTYKEWKPRPTTDSVPYRPRKYLTYVVAIDSKCFTYKELKLNYK